MERVAVLGISLLCVCHRRVVFLVARHHEQDVEAENRVFVEDGGAGYAAMGAFEAAACEVQGEPGVEVAEGCSAGDSV